VFLQRRFAASEFGCERRSRRTFEVGNQAQMWLRVDRPIKNNQPQVGHFDNMDDRPIIANEWRHYDIVADVPKMLSP